MDFNSLNKVMLIGNLGIDPEMKGSEKNICTFRLATNSSYTDREGIKKESTEWHNIVAFGKLGDICYKYLKMGMKVYIDGQIKTVSWEDDQGNKKFRTEIHARDIKFLDKKERTNSENN